MLDLIENRILSMVYLPNPQLLPVWYVVGMFSLPETNIAPENVGLERTVGFRECTTI